LGFYPSLTRLGGFLFLETTIMARNASPAMDAFATATVLAYRLPMLWLMAWKPTTGRSAEAFRMITEKMVATATATVNVQALLVSSLLRTGSNPAPEKLMDAALAPALRRVRANAKRLKRRTSL
jgi:hypothetical protein